MNIELPKFANAHVLVVGDVLLDRYYRGDTSRISPEAPVPIVHVKRSEDRPGGAGNVALNITALGSRACLIGAVGQDAEAMTLKSQLAGAGVECHLIPAPDLPTITKLRVLSRHQQLIRLDFEDEFSSLNPKDIYKSFQAQLEKAKVVILSDYGKGTLQDIPALIALAKTKNIPVFIDPKGSFESYRGASLITPNLKEFEEIVGPCPNEETIIQKARAALEQYDLEGLLVTRGAQGMSLIRRDTPAISLPARALDVFDVTGAGDTVIAVMAACVAAGQDWAMAMAVSNLAAGIVVSKVGTATATETELRHALHGDKSLFRGLLNEEQLINEVKIARTHGEKIVFTNGCFDILHPGHVIYLEQAKALGHRLIVAVNGDESVRQLKGPQRPINSVDHRMQVLSALESVDWVVPFYEDTPLNLIKRIAPDVLVKGGDWQVKDIVGSDFVISHGGEVKSLPFVDGYSTTKIVNTIQTTQSKTGEFA